MGVEHRNCWIYHAHYSVHGLKRVNFPSTSINWDLVVYLHFIIHRYVTHPFFWQRWDDDVGVSDQEVHSEQLKFTVASPQTVRGGRDTSLWKTFSRSAHKGINGFWISGKTKPIKCITNYVMRLILIFRCHRLLMAEKQFHMKRRMVKWSDLCSVNDCVCKW